MNKTESTFSTHDSPLVTEEAVTWAYRLLLGRPPESPEVVSNTARTLPTIQELRRVFMNSEEFRLGLGDLISEQRPFLTLTGQEPPMEIEKTEDLEALFRHIQTAWEQMGEVEAHWSVLTADRFKSAELESNRKEFYHSGKTDVDKFLKTLARNGLSLEGKRTCLEYGCGVGRVTYWLAELFERVTGYDISSPHLRHAKEYLTEQGRDNVGLVHLADPKDIYKFKKVDVIYSIIVLQHNPPPLIHAIIGQFLKVLNPGGLAFFQVPTYWTNYKFSVDAYLQEAEVQKGMEMHVLPQKDIFELVHAHSCRLIEVAEDSSAGLIPGTRSNSFLIEKPMKRQSR